MNPVGLGLLAAGALLFLSGLVDLLGSFAGFDLWGTVGVPLPEIIWRYSAYIELLGGGFLFNLGRSSLSDEGDEDAAEA